MKGEIFCKRSPFLKIILEENFTLHTFIQCANSVKCVFKRSTIDKRRNVFPNSFEREKIYIPNDDNQIREMIGLYKSGLSYSEIGALYGISFQKVGYIFSKKGFKARKHTVSKRFRAAMDGKRKLIDREMLERLYVEERLSTMKIASLLGINQNLVYNNLIFYGIPLRPLENYATSELTPELLKRLYIDQNLTAQQIGDQLGFSVKTVRKRLNKFGIKKRKAKKADAKNRESEMAYCAGVVPQISNTFTRYPATDQTAHFP